jgi:hypothetical protein
MAPDLAIRPVPDRARRHEIIILAEPKAVLYLPTIKAGLYNLRRSPVRIVRNDYIPFDMKMCRALIYLLGLTAKSETLQPLVYTKFHGNFEAI